MSLFGCPGVMPEWPLDQSYETAYAKMVPVRLKVVHGIGPGAGSNAVYKEKERRAPSGQSEENTGRCFA